MAELKTNRGTAIEILGQEYHIVGEEEEYLRKLAQYVDRQMHNLSQEQPVYSPGRLGILTCLNITDELYKLKEKQKVAATQLLDTVNNLINKIDLALKDNSEGLENKIRGSQQ